MSKLAVLLMALTTVVGCSANGAESQCRLQSKVVHRGICAKTMGVGFNVVSVAVPCAAQLDAVGSICLRKI
jgi:hypothetical protein